MTAAAVLAAVVVVAATLAAIVVLNVRALRLAVAHAARLDAGDVADRERDRADAWRMGRDR